jgi:AcrR family transcriptional regulator
MQQDTRTRILLKAQEKFSGAGYRKTSMAEIAGELGMSKKTLYKLFPSKLALMEELLEYKFAQVDRRCDEILASPLDAVEKLFRIIQVVAEVQQRFATNVMLRSLQSDLPHLWQRIERFRRQRMQKNMEAILRQGEEDGAVRTDLNYEMLFHFLFGALREGINPEVLVNASYSLHEALVGLMDIAMNGVLTDAGRAQFQKLLEATGRGESEER